MSRNYYFPKTDIDLVVWFNNFATKLDGYADRLDISPGTLSTVHNEAANFDAVIRYMEALKHYKMQMTTYKDLMKKGPPAGGQMPETASPVPPPTEPQLILPVTPGIFVRLRKLVQTIKNHLNYNEAIGHDLGIIGTAIDDAEDRTTLKPELKIELIAGHPNIKWKKGRADGIKLFVSRHPGEPFSFLTVDIIPDYLDTAPLPPAGASAIWQYQAIYLSDDMEVGEWSNVAKVTVTGK